MSEDDLELWQGAARNSDPITSKQAVSKDAKIRWGSQRYIVLEVFNQAEELTDEEAGKLSGLYDKRAGYWKRCGELREFGFIADTGATRKSECGNEVMVSRITDQGRMVLSLQHA